MRIIHWKSPETPPPENEWVLVQDWKENPGEYFLCRFIHGAYVVKPHGGVFKRDEITGWIYAFGEHQ